MARASVDAFRNHRGELAPAQRSSVFAPGCPPVAASNEMSGLSRMPQKKARYEPGLLHLMLLLLVHAAVLANLIGRQRLRRRVERLPARLGV